LLPPRSNGGARVRHLDESLRPERHLVPHLLCEAAMQD
jgi:hypothetical protein